MSRPSDSLTPEQLAGMTPQLRLVYDYLMTGRELSGLIAMTSLSVMNLTTRIAELRRLGLAVEGAWKDDYRGRRYKAYWLEAWRKAGEATKADPEPNAQVEAQ